MLKIIGGEYRSRFLNSPDSADQTRPMTARTKESIFNLLRGWFDGARVLDLFAGIGTMGLEAVSRGASMVVLFERDREVYRYLKQNIDSLGCSDRAVAIQGDALGQLAIERAPAPVDVVFLDPPYEMMEDDAERAKVLAQAKRLRSVMAAKSFLVLRAPDELAPDERQIEGFDGPETHRHGPGMFVMLYMPKPTGQTSATSATPSGDSHA
jgi:16S rRNA (guanine(966)-N(2))-methyltransferase RsmD